MSVHSGATRNAIITGGSVGIGYEVARQLLIEGHNVLIVGRRQNLVDEAVASLNSTANISDRRAVGVAADVATNEGLDRIITVATDLWGRVDVLVNNAGIFDDATFLTLEEQDWDQVLAVNLTAPFRLTQRVGRMMKESGGGSIVNLASVDGHGVDGTYAAYNISKAAVLHMTRQAAVELGQYGIRCNSVSPGWTHTPMVESALTADQLTTMNENWPRVPLGRMVTVGEVASTIVFLAGAKASGITGSDVVVDGGTVANLWILETLPG